MENKFQEGIDFFSGLTDADPYNFVAWHYLGMSYHDLDMLEDAIRCFDFVNVIDEEYSDAYLQKAECYMDLGVYTEALKALEEAEPFYEFKPRLLYMKGECYEQLQRWEDALNAYQQSVQLVPEMSESWIGMAICLQEMGRLKEGLAHAEHALSLEPDNGHFQLVRAAMLRDLGKFGEAEAYYFSLIEKEPALVETYLELAELYLKLDDILRVESILLEGIAVDDQHPELMYRLAATYFFIGKKNKGIHWLNLALDRHFKGHIEVFTFIPDLTENTYITELIQNHPAYGQDSSLYP